MKKQEGFEPQGGLVPLRKHAKCMFLGARGRSIYASPADA
ncbi:hypothetical protein DES36_1275 [Alkalibaculum bacchi]|uniref:Uncharacterized protein n=1 Tax=Alkalibaculum bacchi TaxID=645887 RepID=A0A366HWI7_9FIRM|nr:hypothetical protein DES36_1275 [Alkalibaculum bacchi]